MSRAARWSQAILAAACLLSGCEQLPTPPSTPQDPFTRSAADQGIRPAALPARPLPVISDATTTGSPTLYFLFPIVMERAPRTAAFDGAAEPSVTVCRLEGSACAETVAQFPYRPGSGLSFATVRQRTTFEFYIATWVTPLAAAGRTYRATVTSRSAQLGFVDIRVVRRLIDLLTVPPNVVGILAGLPLPIPFRIEVGNVDPPPPPPPPPPAADQLPGAPGDPAVGVIPQRVLEPDLGSYQTGSPELPSLQQSIHTVSIGISRNATVGQINNALTDAAARIVGGFPGVAGQADGYLVLRLPSTSHLERDAIMTRLRAQPGVLRVLADALLGPSTVSDTTGSAATWTWGVAPSGGNYGLEMMRVPQMWNLNEVIRRSGTRTAVGVLDVGFDSHADIAVVTNLTPGITHQHGNHVSGTLAARFDNNAGIDGVNPFTDLTQAANVTHSTLVTRLAEFMEARPNLRVINLSLGYNWMPGIDPATNTAAQNAADAAGADVTAALASAQAFGRRLPFIFAAAGNDGGKPAQYGSPFTNAALSHGARPIIVVEAVDSTRTVASFSNLGGTFSGPGVNILSAVLSNGYGTSSGTSMATPHLSGLAGYLLALHPTLPGPTLSTNPMFDLLNANTGVTTGAAPMPDAFATALDIDRIRGDDRILRALLDIDDGSPDGNLRVNPDGTENQSLDIDGDGWLGDGTIDMSDFRRFRDWLLDAEAQPGRILNGAANNPKRDLNGDLLIGTAATENVYPRADFNGDGILHRSQTRAVRGALAGQVVTDLEALASRFADAHYTAADLPTLLNSADLHVDATGCAVSGTALLRIEVRSGVTVLHSRLVSTLAPQQVVTVEAGTAPGTVHVTAQAADGSALATDQASLPSLAPAQDVRVILSCQPELTLEPTPLSVVPGYSAQIVARLDGLYTAAVAWSATGGTISNTGKYTAGPNVGIFQITAVSTANPAVRTDMIVRIVEPTPIPPASFALDRIGGRPIVQPRFRMTVTNVPGAEIRWSHVATSTFAGNLTGLAQGIITGVEQFDLFRMFWFYDVAVPATWPTRTDITLTVIGCAFRDGVAILNTGGAPICLTQTWSAGQ